MSSNNDWPAKIRQNITNNLKVVIKKLQFNAASTYATTLQSSDVTNSLCYVIEAIFLFGLKSPHSTKQIIDPVTKNKEAAPTFWPFVSHFTHSDVASQLSQLKFITNETGLCRSWVRAALNDGLLSSFMSLVVNGDAKIKKKFYNKDAYWFDFEQTSVMTGLIQGIDNYTFDLPHNVSLLNSWGTTPLELAGYFKGTTLPVLFALDSLPKALPSDPGIPSGNTAQQFVESYVNEDLTTSAVGDLDIVVSRRRRRRRTGRSKKALSLATGSSIASQESLNVSGLERVATPQDSEFQMEEEEEDAMRVESSSSRSRTTEEEEGKSCALDSSTHEFSRFSLKEEEPAMPDDAVDEVEKLEDPSVPRESMIDVHFMFGVDKDSSMLSSKSSLVPATDADVSEVSSQRMTPSPPGNFIANNDDAHSTWTNTARTSPSLYAMLGLPHVSNRQKSYENSNNGSDSALNIDKMTRQSSSNRIEGDVSPASSQDFELIHPSTTSYDINEATATNFKAIYTTLTHEKGLPSQNYMCSGCSSPIGTIYGKFKVCAFDSRYYCSRCHSDDEAVIPAYIVNNWDFTLRKVSCAAKSFLTEVENEPLIDFDVINNNLYEYIHPLRVMFDKRKRLKYASNYLFSCSESTANEVKSRLWPKDYMLSNLHLYSVQDLLQLQTGYLQTHLQRVLDFCVKHISSCVLCKQKGFICEICRDSEIIYAFDVEGTVTCQRCSTVFHKRCKSEYAPCPKCVRKANYSVYRSVGFTATVS